MSRMDFSRVWAAVCALQLCSVLAVSGCGRATHDDVGDESALTIDLTERGPGGFDVEARGDDVKVHLELRRGALRPPDWQGDPGVDGFYEGDVLVADARGRVVLIEVGGHAPVDPSWLERMTASQDAIDPELRRRELTLASAAADLLATDNRLDHDARVLARGLAGSVRATLDGFDDGPGVVAEAQADPSSAGEVVDGDAGREQRGVGELRQGLVATYVHQAYIRGAACCWVGYNHSATRLRVFNASGVLVSDTKRRNHGRWVDDPGMKNAAGCPKSWGGRSNQQPFFAPYDATDTLGDRKAGGCNTSYGPLSGQHVCNDDSYVQYTNIKNNPFWLPDYATCGDSSLRVLSPTCF